VTTTILDAHDLEKMFAHFHPNVSQEKSRTGVSGQELVERIKTLFTPEEAAGLARRIEEGRANRHD
jgi:hypothetical protein